MVALALLAATGCPATRPAAAPPASAGAAPASRPPNSTATPAPSADDVGLRVLWTSQRAAVGDEHLERVFTDEESFRTWWQGASGLEARPPAVDFASEVVVAVSSGLRPNACHDIALGRARREGETVVVEVRRRVPAAAAICAAMMVHPTVVAAITRPAASVRFAWDAPPEARP